MASILITGARQGLGLELARQCAAAGWRVLATCLEPGTAEDLDELAAAHPDRFSIHQLDVTNHAEVEALGSALHGTAIDVLYNNAGTKGPEEQDFGAIDYTKLMQNIQLGAKYATAGGGRIRKTFGSPDTPLEFRLTVVLVPTGAMFSGWANHKPQ